jgi:hypothetical protein
VTFAPFILAACSVLAQPAPSGEGSIGGIVLNGSDGRSPVAGAEVVLRVNVDGQFMTAAETVTGADGRFDFAPLPLRSDLEYLPGANRGGIHYPGERIRLGPGRPRASVELVVYDTVAEPSPLVARRHEILVRPAPGALEVTETILVDNPTARSYVGRPASEGGEPVTLELAIPSDFERVTFDREFFGRRFTQAGGKLVTGVPWPPGTREVKFTYLLHNAERHRVWERPLDLPCPNLRLSVATDKPGEVSCNLGRGSTQSDGQVAFECDERTLPAGYVVRLEMGRLPVSWMVYGRWVALAVLAAGAGVVTIRRSRRGENRTRAEAAVSGQGARPEPTPPRHSRPNRRRRKRRASARRRG